MPAAIMAASRRLTRPFRGSAMLWPSWPIYSTPENDRDGGLATSVCGIFPHQFVGEAYEYRVSQARFSERQVSRDFTLHACVLTSDNWHLADLACHPILVCNA